jgi:uncharacterized protein YukE
MADRLEVDLAGLQALAGRLDDIRATLSATRSTIDTARADLGSGDVARALDRFEDHWRDGRERIDGAAEALTAMLRASVEAYRRTDGELQASLEEATTGGPTVHVPRGAQ